MTIGANMPFTFKLLTPVRATGKDEPHGDPKEMSGSKEPQTEFGSLLQAFKAKPKSEQKHSVDEKVIAPNDPHDHEDDNSGSDAQSSLMQPIIALEQLLDRRQSNDGRLEPAATVGKPTLEEAVSLTVSDEVAPSIDDHDVRQGAEVTALPKEIKQESEKVSARTSQPSNSFAPTISGKSISDPVPHSFFPETPQEIEATSLPASVTVKTEKRGSEPAVEIRLQEGSATPDNSISQQAASSLPQITVKPSVAGIANGAAPASYPAVADIQVITDRTTGAARTLVIQLQPVELGTVTARLRLTSEGMHIQIAAASAAMAEHLSNDQEVLGKALHRAGVTDDGSNVTISIVDRSATGAANAQNSQQNLSGHDQQQQGARANGQDQSGSRNTQEERSTNQHPFGEAVPDDHVETLARPGAHLRGLVV